MQRVAVIGGGIGGMTTALLLACRGVEVTLYEKSDKLGGRLVYEEQGGYRIDQGPTVVHRPDMIQEVLQQCGIMDHELQFLPCDPLYRVYFADGSHFDKYKQVDRNVAEIERVFPGAGEEFVHFMHVMAQREKIWHEEYDHRQFVNHSDIWSYQQQTMRLKMKAYKNVRRDVASFFQDPRLIDAYSFQTLSLGGTPFSTPSLFSLLPYYEHIAGFWYLAGGFAHLSQVMEQHLHNAGVMVHLECEIKKLWLSDDGKSCMGIEAQGKRRAYDRVVLNGDLSSITSSLSPNRQVKKSPTPTFGSLLIYAGLNKQFRPMRAHQFYLSESLPTMIDEVSIQGKLSRDPYIYTFYPSCMDNTLAPEGNGVLYIQVPVPNLAQHDWSNLTSYVRFILLQLEEKGFSGLRDNVEWLKLRTPVETPAEGLYQGGSFGIAPSFLQSQAFLPQIKPWRIERLYAVGSSVYPGSGVTTVMLSAKLLVGLLEEEGHY